MSQPDSLSHVQERTTPHAVECIGDPASIAVLLRRCRTQRGLSQQAVAERLGASQSAIARWETGEHEITLTTLARLARALGQDLIVRFPAGGHL